MNELENGCHQETPQSTYQAPQVVLVGKASDLMRSSVLGYLYDAGGTYYVPYQ